ncbi:MAG: acyltransferase domain-containing protein, partial [Phycisphaerae bacterium]
SNRFDFGGTNFTVDAACASSLAAIRLAVTELETRGCDVAIVGGADTMQSPFAYLCFSKTQALSPSGRCRTFDASADGIVTSEGVAVVVMKRLADAERDGDRIYAVVKGVGSSSDGKNRGLTAPRPAGQILAMQRAYEKAGVSAGTVDLVEAHGTGTVAGDQSEIESVSTVFEAAGAAKRSAALGSIKSLIGHTKCTAGIAGLIKAAMALHRKVLPPTAGVEKPNPSIDNTALYINSETRPWIARPDGAPRRAGVSSFGFGGTNFHAVMEEYPPRNSEPIAECPFQTWPAELFIWQAASADAIAASIDGVLTALEQGAEPTLAELAAAVCLDQTGAGGAHRLAVVATSLDDLTPKLRDAKAALRKTTDALRDPRGIYYTARSTTEGGKVAMLFPGQGSQRVNMLRDLAVLFPSVRSVMEEADAALGDVLGAPLSALVYPPPSFSEEEAAAGEAALTETRVAQPAMGAADYAMFRVLSDLGVDADMTAGHSYGEYAALAAAGAICFADLIRVSEARGRLIVQAAGAEPGAMAAVDADEHDVTALIGDVESVQIANLNAPAQTVISGTDAAIDEVLNRCKQKGIEARRIRVACAFHSPIVAGAREPFADALAGVTIRSPRIAVFSNTTAAPHASDADEIRARLVEHLAKPVRFADELRAMHDAGARVFIEVGPGRTLTGLTERTLAGRDIAAVATDQGGRHGLVSLLHALGQLHAAGVRFEPYRLFEQRVRRAPELSRLVEHTKPAPLSPTTWMVDGSRAVPLNDQKKTTRSKETAPRNATAPAPLTAAPSAPAGSPTAMTPSQPVQPAAPELPAAVPASPAASQTAAPIPLSAAPVSGADGVMESYQRLMSRFLETQKNVMLAYLQNGGAAPAAPAPDAKAATPMAAVPRPAMRPAAAPPTPAEMPPEAAPQLIPPTAVEPAVAPVATPAEELAANQAIEPSAATSDSSPTTESGGLTRERLVEQLVGIVSERTGYPPEMLDLDLDLEADFGIDSIKRVEILGALQKNDALSGNGAADGQMEELSKLKTLNAIADWIIARAGEAHVSAEIAGDDDAPSVAGTAPATAADATGTASTDHTTAAKPHPVMQATDLRVPRMLLTVAEAPLSDVPAA